MNTEVSNTKFWIQRGWNVISIPLVVLLLGHVLSTGVLRVSVPVVNKAVAEQLESVEAPPALVEKEVDTVEGTTVQKDEVAPISVQSRDLSDVDVMHLAVSLGRLDFIALGLTTLGVVITVVGLLGFWKVERDSKQISQNVAKEIASRIAETESAKAAKLEAESYLKSDEFQKHLATHMTQELDRNMSTIAARVQDVIIKYYDNRSQEQNTAKGNDDADEFSELMRGNSGEAKND